MVTIPKRPQEQKMIVRTVQGHVEMAYDKSGEPRYSLFIEGDRLMGVSEVAECLGVNVTNLQFVRNLPDPVDHVRATRLWLGSDIQEFAETHRSRRRVRKVA